MLYEFHKDLRQVKVNAEKRADYVLAAVFISKDKLCVLDANREINVCNFDGSSNKRVAVNRKDLGKIESIYPAPLGRVLIDADDHLLLYDLSAKKVINEVQIQEIKRVYWNNGFTHAAIISAKGKFQLIRKCIV